MFERAGYICIAALLATVICATTASAQTESRLAIGVDFSLKNPTGHGLSGNSTVGPLWRFGPGSDGWKWTYGLNWYSAEVDQPIGGKDIPFGQLRVRPFMGGYGYSRRVGPLLLSGNLLAGIAFTSFDLSQEATGVYRGTYGTAVDAHSSTTWVASPEVSAWYDLTRKVGVRIGAGYTFARPTVTVGSALGQERQTIHADAFRMKLGIVYSIF